MSTRVDTVRGPLSAAELGVTLMHEHVFVLSPEIIANYPEGWGEETVREQQAVDKLNALKAAGVDTIVDLTVIGLGRYIPRIQRVAMRTDLQIVVATGVYTYNDVPMYFHFSGPGTDMDGPEPMVEMFVRDITEGIAGTGVKAAILKCATDEPGLTPGVERVLRAVAVAHRATGVPISTHTHARTRRGLEQQRAAVRRQRRPAHRAALEPHRRHLVGLAHGLDERAPVFGVQRWPGHLHPAPGPQRAGSGRGGEIRAPGPVHRRFRASQGIRSGQQVPACRHHSSGGCGGRTGAYNCERSIGRAERAGINAREGLRADRSTG